MRIYTTEQIACATNAPLERHSSREYSNIKCHSSSANGPDAQQPGWTNGVAIGDCNGRIISILKNKSKI